MYLSLFLGPFSRAPGDDVAVIDLCLEQAVEAAGAGIAMVTFGEQHFSNYEPYCNPFLMAARLAGDLGDTWFGTTIVPLPFHAPLRLAEDASVADLLLRGKFLLGISMGRGGPVPDWANFGLDGRDRQALFDSKLGVLTAALSHQDGDAPLIVDTPYDKGMLKGRLMPFSWRAGGPRIAVGSNTDSTIAMAAARRMPLFLGPCLPTDAAGKFAAHRAAMAQAGADPAEVQRAAMHSLVTRNVIVADTDDEAWELAEQMMGRTFWMDRSADSRSMRQMAETDLSGEDPAVLGAPVPGPKKNPFIANSVFAQSWLIVGSPDTVARQIKEYEAIGIDHLNVRTTVGAFDPELMTRMHRLMIDEVLPVVGSQSFPALLPAEVRDVYAVAAH